jgi:hypothetical protein
LSRSSAYKIQYDIRPSKQTERRILLDILRTAAEAGSDLRTYHYIGFGGFKFYDFEMLYKHLGIRHMTSIELDATLHARCRFNKPFGFINFQKGSLGEYLNRTTFKRPIVAWLDYDCKLSDEVVQDLRTVCTKAPTGSFIFATVDARIPDGLSTMPAAKRLAVVRDEYQDTAFGLKPEELSPTRFPSFAERVVWSVLSESLARRSDGVFVPLIRVFYKDTALMITVGGCICESELAADFRRRLRKHFRFLVPDRDAEPYTIPAFNLTARERRLFDTVATNQHKLESKNLRRLGFSKSELTDYKRMQRFIPSYFETYM